MVQFVDLVTEGKHIHVECGYATTCVLFRLCFLCVGGVFLVRSGSVIEGLYLHACHLSFVSVGIFYQRL